MAQIPAGKPKNQLTPGQKTAVESNERIRSSLFKYYIHDGVDSCRLQLLGELSKAEVPELSGCWATAKTTLACRNLVLDLRKLKKVDDSGKQWIISMVNEGAFLLPENFLSDGFPSDTENLTNDVIVGFFSRLLSFLRGSRTVPAPSPTQAQ